MEKPFLSYFIMVLIFFYDIGFSSAAATYLKITGTGTQTAGVTQTITITAYNATNALETGYAGDKSLIFSGATASLNPSTSPTCTDKTDSAINFNTGTLVFFANGIATTKMRLYKAESASIGVTDGSISTNDTSYKLGVTVSPEVKNKLSWVIQPTKSAKVGTVWFPFMIEITDIYGNRTSDTDSIAVEPSTDSFGGTITKSAISGLATFDDITYSKESTITVRGLGGYLTKTKDSDNVIVSSSMQNYLKITGTGTQTAGGAQTITITSYNANNSVDTTYTDDKTLIFLGANASSSNPVKIPTCKDKNSDVNFGTGTTITFTNGVATTTMTLYRAELASIAVTDGTISTSQAAEHKLTVTVSAGVKNKLSWVTLPASLVNAGITWTAFTIEILDVFGNRTSDIDNITITPSTGSLAGTTTKAAISGLVTFNDIADNTSGTITVTGSANGITQTSASNILVNPFSSGVIAKTGQTTSYANGDDGAKQAGIAWPSPRFIDNSDGTVSDRLTGLMWLKDASCIGSWTWVESLTKVSDLNAHPTNYTCGGYNKTYADWRLPNINELKSMVNTESANPATWLNSQGFADVQSYAYWSSSTYASYTSYALSVFINLGYINAYDKTNTYYVWPVRDGQGSFDKLIILPKTGQTTKFANGDDGNIQSGSAWTSPRFIDNGDGTITDNLTGLMWLKNANYFNNLTWQNALDKVKDVNNNNFLNYKDWRLPNRDELSSLIDRSKSYPALPQGHPFTSVQTDSYWSSSTFANSSSNAWYILLNLGNVYYKDKNYSSYVWPVRDAKSRSFGKLTVFKSGGGSGTVNSSSSGINCGSECSSSYAIGTNITLTATPNSGQIFSGWSGECSGTGDCNVAVNSIHSVTANFNYSYLKITGTDIQTADRAQIITITAYDTNDKVASGYTGDKTLTFSGANLSTNPAKSPTCTNKFGAATSFGTGTLLTFTNGVATTIMRLYKAESVSISATDGAISTNNDFYKIGVTVSPGVKNKLSWVVKPTKSIKLGTVWFPFMIEILDEYGNRTSDTDNITISPTPSTEPLGGTTTKAAVSGLVTFDNITYSKPAIITVAGSLGSLATSASDSIVVSYDEQGYLKITGAGTQTAGDSQLITITAYNASAAVDTTYTGDKTLTFLGANVSSNPATSPICYDKTTSPVSFLSGTLLAFTNGVATTTMKLYKAESVSIAATDGTTISTRDVSHKLAVTVSKATKSKLLWSIQPSTPVVAGAVWAPPFAIEITDSYGNRTSDIDDITIAPSSGSFGGGTATKAAVSGLATFDNIFYIASGTITLKGSSGSLTSTPVSKSISITPVSASYLKITGTGTQTAGGPQNLTITAYDKYNNIATGYTGDKTLTFSGANKSANPSILPTSTNKTGAPINFGTGMSLTFKDGIATTTMTLYKAESATISVTDGSISTNDTSYKLVVNVSSGVKNKLLWITQPASQVMIGEIWTTFSIEITDYYGNRTADTDNVTIVPSSGTFGGTTIKAAVSGLVSYSDITYNTSGTITIIGTSGNLTATSPSNNVLVQKSYFYFNGDFNGDGKADILWRHKGDGRVAIWLMDGTKIQEAAVIGSVEDLNWEILNAGDFNGDGKADILWRHKGDGRVAIWLMNGTAIQSYGIAGAVEDLNWEILNVGDFNGDGKADILWRHKGDGRVAIWLMNGTAIQSYGIAGAVEDLNWEIINVGDFDSDGKADLLWRHKVNGKIAIWLINGTAIQSYGIAGAVEDLNWEILNVGDFNKDGKADILWRNKGDGRVAIWLINGTAIQSDGIAGAVEDLNWEIINVGDFDADKKSDLLWRHKVNGKVAVWLMNGTGIQSSDIAGAVEDLNWEINNRYRRF